MARFDFAPRMSPVLSILLSVVATGCGSHESAVEPSEFPLRFLVTNALIAPITISIDGTPYVVLTSGKTTHFTVSSRAQWLTWTSAKPTDSAGQPIPDDIGEIRLSVSGISDVLEIRNVLDDGAYITARIFNLTTSPVSIGVYDGSVVKCAGALPGATVGANGVVQIGYYRLRPATEVRAYRAPGCAGPFLAWPRSLLVAYQAKSGLLTLALEASP